MSDIPRRAVVRTAKLATLPLGLAGRGALGLGKRLAGVSADAVVSELQQRTAAQLFRVLGELKGGAMKLGQALSVFEAALPEHLAAPYRAALTALQDAAPPLPAATVHRVLAAELGAQWRKNFRSFDDRPAAAASIGQVHKAVWADGRVVAVKIQYPGAGQALLSDLTQLGALARLFGILSPGLDVKPLVSELKARISEELDYRLEADAQARFAEAFDDDSDIHVPRVVAHTDRVLVTEWVDGTPLSAIIRDGSPEERDRAGLLLVRFLFAGPALARMLHADPHPGNFRMTDDGRLVVLDYGAVNRLPDGLPPAIGRLMRLALDADDAAVLAGLREEGFVKPGVTLDADAVMEYLSPFLDPARQERFHFSRSWLRREAARVGDPRSPSSVIGRQLNLPPSYLLIHRVWLGGVGVLCQLDAEGPFQSELLRWVPGFAPTPPPTPAKRAPAKRAPAKRAPRKRSAEQTAAKQTAAKQTAAKRAAPRKRAPRKNDGA